MKNSRHDKVVLLLLAFLLVFPITMLVWAEYQRKPPVNNGKTQGRHRKDATKSRMLFCTRRGCF